MVLSEARDAVSAVAIANETEIVAGSVDGRVRAYDVRNGQCTTDRLPVPVGGLRLTRDGKAMAVSTLDSCVRMLDRGEGKLLQSFPKEERDGGSGSGLGSYQNQDVRLKAAFGLREEVLLSGSEADGRVRSWDVLTGREVASVEPSRGEKPLAKSREDKAKAAVVSVVEWRGQGGLGDVWACGGVEGRVWVYGNGKEA